MSDSDLVCTRWQPTLHGTTIRVRPLVLADHEALFRAAADPLIWEQHSAKDRYLPGPFRVFFEGALSSGGALIVEEKATGRVIGCSRFYDWIESQRSILVGYTFLTRDHWGRGTNQELKGLMLDYAFHSAGAECVGFQVSPGNLRSQRALLKLGALYSHEEDVEVAGILSARHIFRLEKRHWLERATRLL